MKPRRNLASASRGFSLIEVMIAMFVLAVGLLGFGMLQSLVLRYSQSAQYRTQATSLAYDLFDQMRANRALLTKYVAITDDSFTGVTGSKCAHSLGNSITPEVNMTRWRCQVRATLGPGATAVVTANTAGDATVTIRWQEVAPRTASKDATASTSEKQEVRLATRI